MHDRLLTWLGASVLAAGLSTATLLGASIAVAEPGSDPDGGVTSSAAGGDTGEGASTGNAKSIAKQQDSEGPTDSTGSVDGDDDGPDVSDEDVVEPEDGDVDPAEDLDNVDTEGEDSDSGATPPPAEDVVNTPVSNTPVVNTPVVDNAVDSINIASRGEAASIIEQPADVQTPAPIVAAAPDPRVETPDVDELPTDTADATAGEPPGQPGPLVAAARAAVGDESDDAIDTETFALAQVEAAPPAPPGPTLINIIGSFFFGILDIFTTIFEGPPAVPPGSTVRVSRSVLEIDCGDGYQAATDWYFPTEAVPDRIIYFQHGAFARAGLYNYTAAELADRNNAIVLAPSITSNYFACDGCQMAGEQMHAAVAKLFLDDRAALLASAKAAGFTGTALPRRFVIAGHSGGGQTAGGAAGYYAQFAPADRLHDMAGVLLFDSSPIGGAIERGVRKIPPDIPVYAISAEAGPLNDYGGVNEVLARVRPGFVGVQVIGGAHGDAWQSSNALAQLFVGIGTGFPQPRNVEAVHVLAQAWIADWFNDTHTEEFYGERSEVITIGPARGYVIPGPAPQLTIIDLIIKAVLQSTAVLSAFSGNCAADPSAPTETGSPQNSTPNSVLTLDGKAFRGQSVGQHVCEG